MAMLASILNVFFCVIFFFLTSSIAVIVKLMSFLPLEKAKFEEYCLVVVRVFWTTVFIVCPWIRLSRDPTGWDEFNKVLGEQMVNHETAVKEGKEKKHQSLMSFANHSSFIDVPLSAVTQPYWVYIRGRTYMKQDLFNIPILSTICYAVGHFPVHFASDADGVFKVNAEKMEAVEAKVDKFITNGGYLSIFPEGQVNKNPDVILPLRYGSLKKCLEHDTRIAVLVYYGNPKVWDRKAKVAGYPGKIKYGARVIAPDGARAYAKKLRDEGLDESEKELTDYALMALRIRKLMQDMYDQYKSDVEGESGKKSN